MTNPGSKRPRGRPRLTAAQVSLEFRGRILHTDPLYEQLRPLKPAARARVLRDMAHSCLPERQSTNTGRRSPECSSYAPAQPSLARCNGARGDASLPSAGDLHLPADASVGVEEVQFDEIAAFEG